MFARIDRLNHITNKNRSITIKLHPLTLMKLLQSLSHSLGMFGKFRLDGWLRKENRVAEKQVDKPVVFFFYGTITNRHSLCHFWIFWHEWQVFVGTLFTNYHHDWPTCDHRVFWKLLFYHTRFQDNLKTISTRVDKTTTADAGWNDRLEKQHRRVTLLATLQHFICFVVILISNSFSIIIIVIIMWRTHFISSLSTIVAM